MIPHIAARQEARLKSALDEGRAALNESEAKDVLASFGIKVPASSVVDEGEDPGLAIARLRPPFVLKVMSPDAIHKTEMGGVRLSLPDAAAVSAAMAEIRAKFTDAALRIDGWLIEEMAPKGIEVVIGGMVDPRFGPVVMFGLGGIMVELMSDVSFRICPITHRDAHQMCAELKGAPLLRGWRNGIVASEAAIVDVLMRIGGERGVMMTLPTVGELDINPLIVSEREAFAVDARIILRKASADAAS